MLDAATRPAAAPHTSREGDAMPGMTRTYSRIVPPNRTTPPPNRGYLEPYRHPTSQAHRNELPSDRRDFSGDRPCG
jgi:hypothetical protein